MLLPSLLKSGDQVYQKVINQLYQKMLLLNLLITFYRIESVPLFLSSHKVKINRPKHTTYPIGELVKLKISGEK